MPSPPLSSSLPVPPSSRRGRRMIGMLIGSAMALSILYPFRQYTKSKTQLRALVRQEQQILDQTHMLEQQKKRLSSDAEVERLAREHLHYVRPNEVAFAITGAVPKPTLAALHPAKSAPQHRAWYQSFWHWLTGD